MVEENKVNLAKPAFSFGLAEQFKEQSDQTLHQLQERAQLLQDSNPYILSQEEAQRRSLNEIFKGQLPMATYEYWDKRLKGKEAATPKTEFKNPLSIKVNEDVTVEPIVKPELSGGKPGIKELGVKGKFDWDKVDAQLEVKSEFKNGEFQKAGITFSGKF